MDNDVTTSKVVLMVKKRNLVQKGVSLESVCCISFFFFGFWDLRFDFRYLDWFFVFYLVSTR